MAKNVAVLIAALALFLATARAEPPAATAVLDRSQTTVGQPVQRQVKISGASNAAPPREIVVDRLEIPSDRHVPFIRDAFCN